MKNSLYTAGPDLDVQRDVLDEVEASQLLSISERKLRYLRQQKQIPHARIGKQVRYVRAELLKWLVGGGNKQEGVN